MARRSRWCPRVTPRPFPGISALLRPFLFDRRKSEERLDVEHVTKKREKKSVVCRRMYFRILQPRLNSLAFWRMQTMGTLAVARTPFLPALCATSSRCSPVYVHTRHDGGVQGRGAAPPPEEPPRRFSTVRHPATAKKSDGGRLDVRVPTRGAHPVPPLPHTLVPPKTPPPTSSMGTGLGNLGNTGV